MTGIARQLLHDKQELAADLADGRKRPVYGAIYSAMARRPALKAEVDALCERWLRSLQVAEDYAVAARIHPLLMSAAEDLPDDYVAEHHHLHAEHGFLWLEDTITDEVHGPGVRVLTWHAGLGRSDRTEESLMTKESLVPGLEINVWAASDHGLIPIGADFLPWGLPSVGWSGITGIERNLSLATRYILAFQTFVKMELPEMERVPLPKSQRRPMERLGLPSDRSLTVVDLRHRKTSSRRGDGGERKVTVQHVVRGHWHAYHVSPKHPLHSHATGQTERVHIYVHPFLRGPEDGPLAMTDRVNVARR